MGESEEKKPKSTASWQRSQTPASEVVTDDTVKETEQRTNTDEQRQSLLKSAAKFLEDDDIRNAPIERKKFFLGSKGLTEDEIQDLLQEQGLEQVQHIPEAEVMEDYGIEKEASQLQARTSTPKVEPEVKGSPSITHSGNVPSRASSNSEGEQTTAGSTSNDVPPIITYPEFLVRSQKPPPLITAHRILTTLYVASGAAATLYGTSKYIIEPMIGSLTLARQSLAETASSNLETLNRKLESAVSKVPDVFPDPDEKDEPDIDSTDSDPSRFFSRSAGTQTSPNHSRSPSCASSEGLPAIDPCQSHESNLSAIHSRLSDVKATNTNGPVEDSISEFRKFLDGLPHANTLQQNGKLWRKAKSDEYGKLKAEIRGVKGVLLSARNFPSSVPVR